ncbi:MAG: glycoside hydrolase family 15 protein [Actinobacteria bacterium]|nr:glycoside hydrolase family 15 protein [Actinomycetota bacterium]
MSHHPIGEHAFLSDLHSAALVDRDGTVDWLCFPRFDSASVFGALLDDTAGEWRLGPRQQADISRRYLDRSLALETTFTTRGGTVTVTDALTLGEDPGGHLLGRDAPHTLIRIARCVEGEVGMQMSFRPRPEYGLAVPLLRRTETGVATWGGPDQLTLSTPVPVETSDGQATATWMMAAGQEACFTVQWTRSWENDPEVWTAETVRQQLQMTVERWQAWSRQHQAYDGPWSDLVHLSGRVLQGLTFEPTGAVVAAATTSLPESVGGERNWDYRYAWVRDASLTMNALWVAACPDEADAFLRWMVGSAAADLRDGGQLQIMYGVGGEHDLTERELTHLRGWRDSRPVRVGNAAWGQRQFDVFGELLDATHRLREQIGDLDQPSRRFLTDCADAAAQWWPEPDQGIWEMRSPPQHFLYSKLMCWVALDRAIDLASWLDADDKVAGWEQVREQIRDAILSDGWNERAGAFTQSFGSEVLDASALMLAITGFLPAGDQRMQATIAAIEEHLTDQRGLVYRYEHATDDGQEGREGTFLLCSFWLAHCHALAGDVARARDVFERAIAPRNDLGLLAEQVDPTSGELLGNFPQAFSHVGLVNAAWAISRAERENRP